MITLVNAFTSHNINHKLTDYILYDPNDTKCSLYLDNKTNITVSNTELDNLIMYNCNNITVSSTIKKNIVLYDCTNITFTRSYLKCKVVISNSTHCTFHRIKELEIFKGSTDNKITQVDVFYGGLLTEFSIYNDIQTHTLYNTNEITDKAIINKLHLIRPKVLYVTLTNHTRDINIDNLKYLKTLYVSFRYLYGDYTSYGDEPEQLNLEYPNYNINVYNCNNLKYVKINKINYYEQGCSFLDIKNCNDVTIVCPEYNCVKDKNCDKYHVIEYYDL